MVTEALAGMLSTQDPALPGSLPEADRMLLATLESSSRARLTRGRERDEWSLSEFPYPQSSFCLHAPHRRPSKARASPVPVNLAGDSRASPVRRLGARITAVEVAGFISLVLTRAGSQGRAEASHCAARAGAW